MTWNWRFLRSFPSAIKMTIGTNNWDVETYKKKLEKAAPGKKSLHFFALTRVLQFHLALYWTSLLILPIQLLYFFSQLLYFFISLHFFVQILVRGWVTTYSQQQCNGLALVADFLSWVESSMTWVVECQIWVP